ncbi:glycoside hydrolase family 97 protein [Flavivirga algicola]|uniref:Glycoside hydrolase family 97 protein n=1 Tax=Flavivirga algicola TaxID=2729136 RepID=A0ABX1RYG1_9FLAO|nr:glycoside hydrolase family 97 protein [Flavivirga algicola]NMH88620.1 glycoside hydrolase family 97 protein [Flavivirga algicola]
MLFSIITISCSEKKKSVEVKSPDGHFNLLFNIDEKLGTSYSVKYKGHQIIEPSGLGIGAIDTTQHIEIDYVKTTKVDSSWIPVYGEKNQYQDTYQESFIALKGDDIKFNLRIRAYNEGVAFRYEFPKHRGKIEEEKTEFSLPLNADVWASRMAQKEIKKSKVSEIDTIVERPLLIQLNDSLFAAIGEAGLVDYSRMKFMSKPGYPGTLVSKLDSLVQLSDSVDKSPWRFIMAGERPAEILENNYLILNLNEPNKIENTSWIKPGKIIRESTLTTQGGMACVDFAEKHHLQFIEFDAGWYGNEYDEASDATTVTIDPNRSNGPLDLKAVIQYAKSKNIGVVLYVNRRSMEKQLDDVLPLLSSWGVTGLKYGFVNVGSQEWTSWLHDAVRKAADHKLMVDIHDEYRPTGYSRTYPNLMTQEGIRGDEESPKNSMVLNTLFTRMIAGAGDQTNCYFAPRVTEIMGSHTSQLAKAVCIYSPWQFLYWYDRPEGSDADGPGAGDTKTFIQEVPELAFYDALPTVWDDTKIIDGFPGEYGIVARRSGDDWFVGALTGVKGRQLNISLDFLDKNKNYEATIYSDDENSTSITKVNIETRKVNSNDTINHQLLKENGLAMHIRSL